MALQHHFLSEWQKIKLPKVLASYIWGDGEKRRVHVLSVEGEFGTTTLELNLELTNLTLFILYNSVIPLKEIHQGEANTYVYEGQYIYMRTIHVHEVYMYMMYMYIHHIYVMYTYTCICVCVCIYIWSTYMYMMWLLQQSTSLSIKRRINK